MSFSPDSATVVEASWGMAVAAVRRVLAADPEIQARLYSGDTGLLHTVSRLVIHEVDVPVGDHTIECWAVDYNSIPEAITTNTKEN